MKETSRQHVLAFLDDSGSEGRRLADRTAETTDSRSKTAVSTAAQRGTTTHARSLIEWLSRAPISQPRTRNATIKNKHDAKQRK